MKVLLKYSFIFDPSELWAHRSQFEEDLSAWLRTKGVEGEIIETFSEDEAEERIIFITKSDQGIPVPHSNRSHKQRLMDITKKIRK